ncbi:MAG: hypothetical protein QHI38_01975 [Armatimonadota bacterium]|nr:hypothetical protein [Armatimonadota bacterium]
MFRVILAFLLAGSLSCRADAAFWSVELAYDGGSGAGDCSLALDHQGVPHITYTADGVLYHAVRTLTGWTAEPIQTVGYWGGLSSIAFDTANRPCAAFVDSTDSVTNYLCFARKGAAWSTERVADIGWWADHVSLAVSPTSQPCIAFCRTVGADVFVSLARRLGADQWSIENIAVVGSVTGPSVAFTDSGTAYVAFVDSDSGLLKIARNDGYGWTIVAVDGGSGQFAVSYPSLGISPSGNPVVAYFLSSESGSVLKLAVYTGSSWEKQTIAQFTVPVYFAHCAALVTPSGLPLVVYQDPSSSCLKAAWKIGPIWATEEIDSAPMSGGRPCIRYGGTDLYLCYFDGLEFNVKLARASVPLTVQQAKSFADGSPVEISWLVASAGSQDFANAVYVQSVDRTGGLKLRFTSAQPAVSRGDMLDVKGVITTIDGERTIVDPVVRVY